MGGDAYLLHTTQLPTGDIIFYSTLWATLVPFQGDTHLLENQTIEQCKRKWHKEIDKVTLK